ncbi:MAG: branched-chain amino acid ABC transporter permease [Deltaproteobacteria bacterium]|nr:branched-chain amino acid ABC transporter permease [Deltaproteobacteria bacterium]
MTESRIRHAVIVVLLLTLAAVPYVSGKFIAYLTMRVMLLGIFAVGFNLLLGQTGLLSFGHGAFYAAGAYGLGLFGAYATPNPLLGVAVGIAAATVVALLVGYLCVRHTEIYFAMLTLACGMMVFSLIWNARVITGGDDGFIGIMRAPVTLFGGLRLPIGKDSQFYYFVLAFFVLAVWVAHRIRISPFGLVLSGIRENARRTEYAGVPVRKSRLAVFVLSGAFAGLAGSLEALLESNARPFMAHWTHSAEPVLVSLLGGLSSLFGPIVGSAFFIAMREITQRYTENWMLGFGVVLLVVIMGFRGGIMGAVENLFRRRSAGAGR